eukprot:4823574-Pyramimonas_sp.AAC.1
MGQPPAGAPQVSLPTSNPETSVPLLTCFPFNQIEPASLFCPATLKGLKGALNWCNGPLFLPAELPARIVTNLSGCRLSR